MAASATRTSTPIALPFVTVGIFEYLCSYIVKQVNLVTPLPFLGLSQPFPVHLYNNNKHYTIIAFILDQPPSIVNIVFVLLLDQWFFISLRFLDILWFINFNLNSYHNVILCSSSIFLKDILCVKWYIFVDGETTIDKSGLGS